MNSENRPVSDRTNHRTALPLRTKLPLHDAVVTGTRCYVTSSGDRHFNHNIRSCPATHFERIRRITERPAKSEVDGW